jgi:hypothetical protein
VLQALPLVPGFWRAAKESVIVRECPTDDRCTGGLSAGDGVCGHASEGPMCQVTDDPALT